MIHRTVLLIDDEQNVTRSMRRILRGEPYRILTADSAEEAFRILEQRVVDVIISDEMMPGMSGSEFFAAVRQRHPDIIRIILTGHASLDAAIRAINQGEVYRFLTKPCRELDLIQTIRQALQQKRLMEETNRLLRAFRAQSQILQKLERRHPGITRVQRDETGTIIIGEDIHDYEKLIDELGLEMNRSEYGIQKS